jgi:hypothetical protein
MVPGNPKSAVRPMAMDVELGRLRAAVSDLTKAADFYGGLGLLRSGRFRAVIPTRSVTIRGPATEATAPTDRCESGTGW